MFTKHRGTLTLITLLAVTSIALGGGYWLWSLPVSPATASREQLMRCLVLQDLRQQPRQVQQAWVDRLQRELTADFTPPNSATELSPRYQQQLTSNIQTLQAVWFDYRTEQYATLTPETRTPFMQEQIELIAAWPKLAKLDPQGAQSPEATLDELIAKIDRWIVQATGERHAQMIRAVEDGTVCWLATCDLAEHSHGVRRQLAARIAQELDRGAKPRVAELATSTEQQQTLQHNAELLAESYVHLLAGQFQQLPTNQRPAFIDRQLADIERWNLAQLLDPKANSDQAAQLGLLQKQSHRWIQHSPSDERDQVFNFVQATTQRIVWRQMPAWLRKQ